MHRRKKTKAQIKAERLRNLKKARAAKRKGASKKKEFRICFCKTSIKWIMKHLQKSAKSKFKRMIGK